MVEPQNNNGIDQGEQIKYQIRKYIHFWYLFALGLVLALIGAFLYLRYTPKLYKSNAKIKILNKTKGIELPSSAFIFNRSNINLENEVEILKSYRIIENVVDELDLTMQFFDEGNVLTTELNHLPFYVTRKVAQEQMHEYPNKTYAIEVQPNSFEVSPLNTENTVIFEGFDTTKTNHDFPFELSPPQKSVLPLIVGKTYLIKFATTRSITNRLKNNINISMIGKNSDLLKLSYSSQSKYMNARILNTLIDVFNQDGINDRQEVSRRTIDFIDERFKLLARELDSIELGIETYKQNNNLITLESDAELGITQRTLSEQELFDVENQIIISNILNETLEQPNPSSALLPANIGLNNTSVNGLVENYNKLVLERDNLITSAGESNPSILALNSRLEELKSNIFASINSYVKQLKATKAQLLRKNKKFASQVYSLPSKEKALVDITRQREIKQSLYLFLLQKREESAINLAITEPSIKVVEYAITSNFPISPIGRNTYLMAIAIGLLVPFGIIYIHSLLDTKVKDREDVTKINPKIPIVGELPKVKAEHLVFDNPNDNSVQAEAFRILSSNVDYILPVKEKNTGSVIFCTSTIKGEGKTYVSLNLSLSLSSINKKVLLIGADLRNPQIHTHIGEDKEKPGLSNYLHDINYDWRDALLQGFDKHPNHSIMLSGSIPPNPAHLLTNGRFKKLIEEARKEYDYVVVDTAPTILVTDTMLISKLADATIYLVRSNYTEKNLLNFSRNLSESGKLKNIAYVINSVDTKKSYGYGYNYGYNYGYGSGKKG